MRVKTAKIIVYICIISVLAVNLPAAGTDIGMQGIMGLMQSETFVLMDGDTGQVLFEKNMHTQMYPASITKVMTALVALESGMPLESSIVTMSYDAVWTVGRDTSHIALDVDEQLTLEEALYAIAIESGNDASNGIAELVSGSMDVFANRMTARAKELGAYNTNFTNAHGLPDQRHYTTAYDMALVMSAAIKIPEFNKIFSTVTFNMSPTNRQPEARQFNRRNSLVEGFYAYDGILSEKTGWTGDAGRTYVAAARRGGRTLVLVLMRSPEQNDRWEDATRLFDYGFNEFVPVGYTAEEYVHQRYPVRFADSSTAYIRMLGDEDFNFLIHRSLSKEDIFIYYTFSTTLLSDMFGTAEFRLYRENLNIMHTELGVKNFSVYLYELDMADPERTDAQPVDGLFADIIEGGGSVMSALSGIYRVISIALQIIGVVAVIAIILYIRRYMIVQKRRKQRIKYNGYNRNYRR